jgi:ElaB/YqjD/DUF883 family membrane-anchored ribosome-binding protein
MRGDEMYAGWKSPDKEQVMTTTEAGSESLNEALAHLNEASKERREEVQKLLDEKYTDLKVALGGAAHASAEWAKEQGTELADKAKLTASVIDKSVRKYPWAYVGGAIATGFLVGR